jgi:hypothetical protein
MPYNTQLPQVDENILRGILGNEEAIPLSKPIPDGTYVFRLEKIIPRLKDNKVAGFKTLTFQLQGLVNVGGDEIPLNKFVPVGVLDYRVPNNPTSPLVALKDGQVDPTGIPVWNFARPLYRTLGWLKQLGNSYVATVETKPYEYHIMMNITLKSTDTTDITTGKKTKEQSITNFTKVDEMHGTEATTMFGDTWIFAEADGVDKYNAQFEESEDSNSQESDF